MTISCKRIGTGAPTRVLLHGFASNVGTFVSLMPFLRGKGSLVLIDLPGHGNSTVPSDKPVLRSMIDSIVHTIREQCPDAFRLVGHSMGGMIASHVAAAMPERVEHLHLISCAGVGPDVNRSFFRSVLSAATEQELLASISVLYSEPPNNLNSICKGTFSWLEQPGVRLYLFRVLDQAPHFKAELQTALDRGVAMSGLWGEDDAILSINNARHLPPGIPLRVLQGVGHAPHVEAPSAVAQWLLDSA